jgi:hypothetical protein
MHRSPPRGGGGAAPDWAPRLPAVEALSFAFAVAAEAIGADHWVLVVQVVEDGALRRMRCGSWCRAACN